MAERSTVGDDDLRSSSSAIILAMFGDEYDRLSPLPLDDARLALLLTSW